MTFDDDEHELARKLHRAVDHVSVRSRLDEIQAPRASSHRSSLWLLAGAAIVVLGVIGVAVLLGRRDAPQDVAAGPTSTTSSTASPSTTVVSTTARSTSPPSTTVPRSSTSTTIPRAVPPDFVYGLIDHDNVDRPLASTLAHTNGYGGTLGGTYYYVVAGSPNGVRSEGELFIGAVAATGAGATDFSRSYLPGHGALTIQSASLPEIVVRATDGTTFAFDLNRKAFTPR